MAKLKPWFDVIKPREDLREGRPMDASEFAVHLDHVREHRAPKDYQDPERFFERTFLTKNLKDLAAQTVRRLSGIAVETSAVFNMATQFGGGKTHSLTLLYHLANAGPESHGWQGVGSILEQAQVKTVPKAATAVFVGTEFDSFTGRGGSGEPLRRTPWGEIAWQLGGEKAFAVVASHDEEGAAPGGDVIRAFLPEGPTLILMDELLNYINRCRNHPKKLGAQFHNFLHNLSEEARSRDNLVLVVSIPASELEMTVEDQRDYDSIKKLLNRLGKAVIMSAETDHAEIIRRRLFEWSGLPDEAKRTAAAYAEWLQDHKQLIGEFDADTAKERFLACYPFHPALLSVFERKWQSLPRFQKTRGVLRLLALWVSQAYKRGYEGDHRDPLIGLGTAPLDDPYFRAALFEQLGNDDLEGPVTTDISGKKDAHALRLDKLAPDAVKKARLHLKIATTILFESNGGTTKAEATVPEIRLAVAEPDLDIANAESALEALGNSCYYLTADHNRYRFSMSPNLNKLLTDRRSGVSKRDIDERVKQVIQEVFNKRPPGLEWSAFPGASGSVPDRPALTLVVMASDQTHGDPGTRKLIEQIVREYGQSGRTFKSALIFAVPENDTALREEARKLLAWEDLRDDDETVKRLDEGQRRQLDAGVKKAPGALKEAVWRTYKHLLLLGKDNMLQAIDLGQYNSSAAGSLAELYVNRLRERDEITEGVGANKLIKAWPPANKEWTTKAVRDAFFSSPLLPRLLNASVLRRTIADGVNQKLLAYAGKGPGDQYNPFIFEPDSGLAESDVELSDEMVILRAEDARLLKEPPRLTRLEVRPLSRTVEPGASIGFTATGYDQHGREFAIPEVSWSSTGGEIDQHGQFVAGSTGVYQVRASAGAFESAAEVHVVEKVDDGSEGSTVGSDDEVPIKPIKGFRWKGTIPPQKWMNFYTKVLSGLVSAPRLKLEVHFEVTFGDVVNESKIEATKSSLRELGLSEDVEVQTG
jgi:Protein of unknown function (DUF499)